MTDPVSYQTVARQATARFEVRGSRFMGHVRPVDTVADAEQFIASVRAAYDDATHNVPAYRVPAGQPSDRQPSTGVMIREYSSDDGEPTGSAGTPALNVLQQRDLRNVVVVVTRYYGGTNLGVGGLTRMYARATSEAVNEATVIKECPHQQLTINTAYDDSGTVRGILESTGVEFAASYEEIVQFDARVAVTECAELIERLNDATSGRVDITS